MDSALWSQMLLKNCGCHLPALLCFLPAEIDPNHLVISGIVAQCLARCTRLAICINRCFTQDASHHLHHLLRTGEIESGVLLRPIRHTTRVLFAEIERAIPITGQLVLFRQRRIQPPNEVFLQRLRIKAVIINRLLERIFVPGHSASLHLSHCFHGPTLQCIRIHQLRTAKLPFQWSAQIQHNLNVFGGVIELGRCQFLGAPVAGL